MTLIKINYGAQEILYMVFRCCFCCCGFVNSAHYSSMWCPNSCLMIDDWFHNCREREQYGNNLGKYSSNRRYAYTCCFFMIRSATCSIVLPMRTHSPFDWLRVSNGVHLFSHFFVSINCCLFVFMCINWKLISILKNKHRTAIRMKINSIGILSLHQLQFPIKISIRRAMKWKQEDKKKWLKNRYSTSQHIRIDLIVEARISYHPHIAQLILHRFLLAHQQMCDKKGTRKL